MSGRGNERKKNWGPTVFPSWGREERGERSEDGKKWGAKSFGIGRKRWEEKKIRGEGRRPKGVFLGEEREEWEGKKEKK